MGLPGEKAPGFPLWIAERTSLRIELAKKSNTCKPEFSERENATILLTYHRNDLFFFFFGVITRADKVKKMVIK